MGTLFRALTGFVIALTALHGAAFWSGLKTRPILQVQRDIDAAHPVYRLEASLNGLLAPQKGTKVAPDGPGIRARGLQF